VVETLKVQPLGTYPLDGSSAKIEQGVVRIHTRLLSEARGMPYSEVGRVRMLRR
jgi:hypothetical protein